VANVTILTVSVCLFKLQTPVPSFCWKLDLTLTIPRQQKLPGTLQL